MAYEAKSLVKTFTEMKPDEKVWATWIDRSEIIDKVQEQLDYQFDDETNVEEVKAEQIVTEEFIDTVFNSINDDDYLWERFNENFSETISDLVIEKLKEIEEDKELWDTGKDKNDITSARS